MGQKDLIKPYVESQGEVYFGRLNMKPGKPTTFGRLNDSKIFSLPGNPVSCFVTFTLLVLPAIKFMSGFPESLAFQPKIRVSLHPNTVKLDPERPEYHRAVAIQDE